MIRQCLEADVNRLGGKLEGLQNEQKRRPVRTKLDCDSVRYTAVFDTSVYWDAEKKLTRCIEDTPWVSHVVRRDHWCRGTPYNGIHLDVHVGNPGGWMGCYEVQVHTPVSLRLRDDSVNHKLYLLKRENPDNTTMELINKVVGYTQLAYYQVDDTIQPWLGRVWNMTLSCLIVATEWLLVALKDFRKEE